MMLFMKALVMLEERPVIFMATGKRSMKSNVRNMAKTEVTEN